MMNSLFFQFLLLIAGIVVLMFSGDFLIKGGVALAHRFRVSNVVIGLTVVAFGTSAPELIVSMGAAFTHHPEIALGNVIGSNIANIALILGLTVLIFPMPVAASTIKRSWPVMMISAVGLCLAMLNNSIQSWEGALFFLGLLWFIYDSVRYHKLEHDIDRIELPSPRYSLWLTILIIVGASVGLALGARLLIEGASRIAASFGVSERIISLTIVAFGTSIPELTASAIAALKKESDISVGNIIGSNIFNVFAVIGLTSLVKPIGFSCVEFKTDLMFMLLISVLLLLFMLPWKQIFSRITSERISSNTRLQGGKLNRTGGMILLSIYLIYLFTII